MSRTKVLLEGFTFLESPRWHDGKLWFSDFYGHRVLAMDPGGQTETVCEVPHQPSGLGWLPDGRMLVVSMTDRRVLRLEADGLVEHADLSDLATFHCNDMVVDDQGRAYVGNFGSDLAAGGMPEPAALILVTPDGHSSIVAEDLLFPNGSVITPDGRTLIVGESFGGRMTAFDIAPDGSLPNRRLWAQLDAAIPDGCCIDAEGALWVASPPTREVLRVREGGETTDRISTDQMAIACTLGGDDRRTLYVLTAPSVDGPECETRCSARIESLQVEVPGAGFP
jgi:sugar lactone lactonase YvrE